MQDHRQATKIPGELLTLSTMMPATRTMNLELTQHSILILTLRLRPAPALQTPALLLQLTLLPLLPLITLPLLLKRIPGRLMTNMRFPVRGRKNLVLKRQSSN